MPANFHGPEAKRIALEILPAWFEHCGLIDAIWELGEARCQILKANAENLLEDLTHEKVKAEDLIAKIEAFERMQAVRVQTIQRKALGVEESYRARIDCHSRLQNLREGGAIPSFYSSLGWECESDDGETGLVINWRQCGDRFIREELEELDERLFYESVMCGELENAMIEFSIRTQMKDEELNQWVRATLTGTKLKPYRLNLAEARDRFVKYAKVTHIARSNGRNLDRIRWKTTGYIAKDYSVSDIAAGSIGERHESEVFNSPASTVRELTPHTTPNSSPKRRGSIAKYCYGYDSYDHSDKDCNILDSLSEEDRAMKASEAVKTMEAKKRTWARPVK